MNASRPIPSKHSDLLEGREIQKRKKLMVKAVLNEYQPQPLADLLAEYLIEKYGRNRAELILLAAQDKVVER